MTFRSLVLMTSVIALSTGCSMSRSKTALSIENLLTNSAEVVSFPISDVASVHTIEAWVNDDLPSYASISCSTGNSQCVQVAHILRGKHITVDETQASSDGDKVSLSYDHITARNCPPHALGCSVSANALQMIGNYSQVLHPSVSEPQDATQGVEAYRRAHNEGL